MMLHFTLVALFNAILISETATINLDYLDPTKLQTKTSPQVQQETAQRIIMKYLNEITVEVTPLLFDESKDTFSLRTVQNQLRIRASSGVAALWGFNYYLKKYCKSQIAWQVQNVQIPNPLPEVDETIVANDRFRYYQNVCTASYSFVWWNETKWEKHIEWMAFNGINIALAPVAQEAAWTRIYRRLGMTDVEIDEHFTGPAFLSWFRMGNMRGWGGPLPKSWHDTQRTIQETIIDYMFKLGMIPVLPAFSGHVPLAFARLYPNNTFYTVNSWNKFKSEYCCLLYADPFEPLFTELGKMFLKEITVSSGTNHIYNADPFNEIKLNSWNPTLTAQASKAIFTAMSSVDKNAVWLLQNWMFVHDPVLWPKSQVKSFVQSVPNGRMLILDLQSEQWPQYNFYEMYFGQPFIWCMLHNFGGTLGMFGNMKSINSEVYSMRTQVNSTMIGIGLTPEGINQNYVVYDLMLESAWRKEPVRDLNKWVDDYAERRYVCNSTGEAWRYLLKSVYNFDGLNNIRGKYVVTRRPSFKIRPWAWYRSYDLLEAWRRFVFTDCSSSGYLHDLVDISRQVLQYRAEQLYINMVDQRKLNTWAFNASIAQFLDIMLDMESMLATNSDFTLSEWLTNARDLATNDADRYLYDLNARNQITLWGPNGEISDYACKQWAELFAFYYRPRWQAFLMAALDAKVRKEFFDEKGTQMMVRATVEEAFLTADIGPLPAQYTKPLAILLYEKWANVAGLDDLPMSVIRADDLKKSGTTSVESEESQDDVGYTVVMLDTMSTGGMLNREVDDATEALQ